jgi:hypothetical protein
MAARTVFAWWVLQRWSFWPVDPNEGSPETRRYWTGLAERRQETKKSAILSPTSKALCGRANERENGLTLIEKPP